MGKKLTVMAGAGGPAWMLPHIAALGHSLAKQDWHVWYGGSNKGVMGALAKGVLSAGGPLTGVLPQKLADLKHYPPEMNLVITPDMASRKALFWDADAYLCLPGGVGTLDELFEVWCLSKLGYSQPRPIVVYNLGGFYTDLDRLVRHMVSNGFMPKERARMVQFAEGSPGVLLALVETAMAAQPAHEAIG
jgi:uncharacterized protein (TIGR00730 family)